MNENRPNPKTATPEDKMDCDFRAYFLRVLSGDSSWGYDMFCGWKKAWFSWGKY